MPSAVVWDIAWVQLAPGTPSSLPSPLVTEVIATGEQ